MGGKSSPPPPDYGPLAQASKESAEIMAGLGREQLDFARQQYAEMRPLAERIAESQISGMDTAARIAEEERAYGLQFRPAEERLLAQAMEFDTPAARERFAQQAAADAARAFSTTQGMTSRGLARMGVAPGSGAAMAQMNQNALGLASQRAGAMTGARTMAEDRANALLTGASALGRGQVQTTLGAMGLSSQLGSAGQQSAMAPGNQFMQGLASGASTIGSGQQMQLGGLGNILNAQTSVYNTAQSQADPLASIVGMGLGGWASGGFKGSDRRLKQDIELVGRDERTGLPLYEYAYKSDPSRRFLGVMADEVEAYMPEAVGESEDGYKFVNYAMLGIEMIEVTHG
jgi:hypothetical protein